MNDIIDRDTLKLKHHAELLAMAEGLGVDNLSFLRKQDMIVAVLKAMAHKGSVIRGEGVLSILQDGFGFLRSKGSNFLPSSDDIYISMHQVRNLGLRNGDTVCGELAPSKQNERYFALRSVESVNGGSPEKIRHRLQFDNLTALYPTQKICLEMNNPLSKDYTLRVIDLVAPLGFGQRALIVAPPRTGKTVMMQNIAHALSANHPDAHLIVLLVGERPEEVTDMTRSVKGEVVGSTFDEPAMHHVQVAEMVIEKAKRLVEGKKDVIVLLDSITRLARAYNAIAPSSGKVLTGGVDSNALQRPKRFFGAARNVEEGGSLTIIGTTLVETGSRMDEVIFEEFKGTGNAEIVLDRKLADKRLFPAIDIAKSGTRKEEVLEDGATLSKKWLLRRLLAQMNSMEAAEFLMDKVRGTKNNDDFFQNMNAFKHHSSAGA